MLADSANMEKHEVRAVIKYFIFKRNDDAIIFCVTGECAPAYTTVAKWYSEFKSEILTCAN